MTIRRRLTLSFLAILALFSLNLAIYFWSNLRRQATVESLRRAISAQVLIASINQNVNDLNKQVSLLSQVATDAAGGAAPAGADPAELSVFNGQIDAVSSQISELSELAEGAARTKVESFAKTYLDLGRSWKLFYSNFGVNQSKAITELAIRAEPLSGKVLREFLPELQRDEKSRVDAASANFYKVARLTDRITILIFALSSVFATAVAYSVSRYLTRGLRRLKEGAEAIGSGNLDQRIALPAKDELGDLAQGFDAMAANLSAARAELTLAHEQEKRKSEELSLTLDQLRRTQDQLIVQQKLASLGALTAGIAHEIKNPLNFVTNFAEILVDMLGDLRQDLGRAAEGVSDLLADLEQNAAKIREHGKRADSIVLGMLMHSRGQSGARQTINLNLLLAEYVKLAYHGMRAQDASFNVTIEEDYDSSIGPISAIPHDLSRVFLNVANNAFYAVHQKKLRAGDAFSPTLSVRTRNLGRSAEIRIRDNGDGIPEEIRQKVFEAFFTTKPAGQGTGLGLSMSYDIVVQEHRGEIRIESEPGRFAEFIITLPKGAGFE